MKLKEALDALVDREGGYADHPDDPGKRTMWGVTETVARAYGYKGEMRDMPRPTAVAIYLDLYWTKPGLDRLARVDARVAEELLDTGVNMGPMVAIRFLQRALNTLNKDGRPFPDMFVDGSSGPITEYALRTFIEQRGQQGVDTLLKMLNALQSVRYMELSEGNARLESFQFGWQTNRVTI